MYEMNKTVFLNNLEINNEKPFILIAGPCAIESREHAIEMATMIKEICSGLNINFIYII